MPGRVIVVEVIYDRHGVPIDDHVTNWAQRLFLRVRFLSGSIKMWTPDAVLRYADEIARQVKPR